MQGNTFNGGAAGADRGPQGVAALKKHDMRPVSIVFMIYCLVAAGAFGIEEMIPISGPGLTLTMLIVFPIIWAWPISNMVAEAGSILPSEGGVYVWVREAFGEFWGFQAGWWNTVSIYITNGVYTALVVDYMSQYIDFSDRTAFMIKLIMVAAFTIVNLLGLREVGIVSSVLSALIIAAFAAVTVVGAINWNQSPMTPYIADDLSLLEGLGGSVSICVWMYCGYECISTLAGEVKNPQVIPKGLLFAMPLIALTYVLPTMTGLASVGRWEDWSTEGGPGSVGYADVLADNLGPIWGYAFLFVAIISQCAIFNTYLASGSRGFFVMADDHLCPGFLVKVGKKRGVPYVGVLSLAAVTVLLAQYGFKTLVMAEVIFILALYIILPLAVIKLRKKIPVSERTGCYVMPGGKIGLMYFTLVPMVLAFIIYFLNGTDYFLIGIIGASTGPVFYMACKWMYGGMAVNDPEGYPLNRMTRLAQGDTFRLAVYASIAGAMSLAGSVFLSWYEGDGGAEYYAEKAESVFFSDFWQMIEILKVMGIVLLAIAAAMFIIGRMVEKGRRAAE
ncbi:MAG: APC family permease [Clostridiales Family XIII bacterium]|jgi:amino acid transporter|nr:APC family permease [Clostridiales Family XIII bacterium]